MDILFNLTWCICCQCEVHLCVNLVNPIPTTTTGSIPTIFCWSKSDHASNVIRCQIQLLTWTRLSALEPLVWACQQTQSWVSPPPAAYDTSSLNPTWCIWKVSGVIAINYLQHGWSNYAHGLGLMGSRTNPFSNSLTESAKCDGQFVEVMMSVYHMFLVSLEQSKKMVTVRSIETNNLWFATRKN